ncbi:MAG: ComF family protein [Patescibacteria group bacterium]
MSFLNTILNLIFPANCIGCGKNNEDLCIKCMSSFPEAERESLEWVFPMYDYRHPSVKKAIGFLKYKGKKGFAKIFAEIMYGRIIEELSDLTVFNNFQKPILVPIPLSKKRIRERGFNQATLICAELMKLDKNKPARLGHSSGNFTLEKNILIKVKNGEHQARIENRQKRLKNIIGSFSVKNPEGVKNRNIILIDDVTTTGATLNEAKKTLRKAGAKKIIAFTIAH